MRVALIGAGIPTARRLARDLAEWPEVAQLVVVDADVAFTEMAAQHDPGKTTPVATSLSSESLPEVIAGSDVVVGCVNPPEEEAAASAAARAGVPYLSSSESLDAFEAVLSLDGLVRESGTLAVPGVGWSPGITNLLVRYALEEGGGDQARISWVCSAGGPSGHEMFARAVAAFSGTAPLFEEGSWRREPAGAASESVYFPEPLGWRRVHLCAGAEVLTLPKSYPTLGRVAVSGALAEPLADRTALAAARLASGTSGRRGHRLGGLAEPMRKALARGGAAHGWAAARVDVTGESGKLTLGVLDHPANLTTAALLAGARLVASGSVEATGVVPPEGAFEPRRFFQALGERGVRLARLEA